MKNSKLLQRQAPENKTEQKEPPAKEKVADSFKKNLPKKKRKKTKITKTEANKRPFSDYSSFSDAKTTQLKMKSDHFFT